MKRLGRSIIPIVFLSLFAQGTVFATPSTTYWTPATSDVQPFNVWHIGVDNYFRLYQTQQDIDKAQGMSLPTDVGLTVGVLPYEKINMEVGIDYLAPAVFAHPALQSMGSSFLFNTKLGTPEGAFLGSWFPALNLGIFNVGTKSGVTSMNIVDFLVGKTLGRFGRIHGGGYYGNPGSVLMNKMVVCRGPLSRWAALPVKLPTIRIPVAWSAMTMASGLSRPRQAMSTR